MSFGEIVYALKCSDVPYVMSRKIMTYILDNISVDDHDKMVNYVLDRLAKDDVNSYIKFKKIAG